MRIVLGLIAVGMLAACQPTPSAAPQAAAPTTPAKPAPAKPVSIKPRADQSKLHHTAFSDVQVCAEKGYTQIQCDRALGTAMSMHRLDAPRFKDQASCQEKFAVCGQIEASKEAPGGWVPQMGAFSVGDEKAKSPVPLSEKAPAHYTPVYRSSKNEWVVLLGPSTNMTMSYIPDEWVSVNKQARIPQAKQPFKAPATSKPTMPATAPSTTPAPAR